MSSHHHAGRALVEAAAKKKPLAHIIQTTTSFKPFHAKQKYSRAESLVVITWRMLMSLTISRFSLTFYI